MRALGPASPCDWKHHSGSHADRATEAGYWKTTGRHQTVHSRSTSTGVKKTLSFYKGRPPRGEKTQWMMHEYHLDEKEFKAGAGLQNAFVLCHVLKVKKNELPEKSGGFQSAEMETSDSSLKNRNPSCDEDKSEDRSKQLEEVQTYSSLPHVTEDTAELNMCLGPGKDTINQQVDSMPNGLGSNCEFGWLPSNNNDFPQVPADISFTRPEATDGYLTGEEMDEYIDGAGLIEQILNTCEATDGYFTGEEMDEYIDGAGLIEQILNTCEATDVYLTGEETDEYDEADLLEDILDACEDSQNSDVDQSSPQDSYADISNPHAYQDSQNSNVDHSFPQDSYADISNGNYIELNDFENCDSSLSFDSVYNNGGPGIQLRPRSPALHSYQQDVSSEDTSKRRVRMQVHKMEALAGPNEKYVATTNIHYASSCLGENQIGSMYDPQIQQLLLDTCGEHEHNLEIENSATGNEVINWRDESSWCQEHEVIDPANFSSVFNYADILVSHSLLPTSLQPSAVLNVEPSETIEMSPNTFDTGVKHDTISLNRCQTSFQALSSSKSGTSPPVMSITEKIDKSNISEHACFEGCVVESDKLSVIELLHKSVNSVSENPKALLSQAACLGENSTFVGSLPNSGTLSLVQLEEKSSALNSSEGKLPTSPNEGSRPSNILIKFLGSIPGSPASAMELPATLKSDKHTLGLQDTSNSGSSSNTANSDYVPSSMLKKVSSKGIFEYPRLDTASSELRARSVQESNIVAGGKDKRREAGEDSAGPSPSSVQPRGLSGLFSQLSKRISLRGSHGGVVLTCLFGTAFLFLFFLLSSILGIFASTYSAVAV
ncbi:uncharacterized protein LOC131076324 isoform X2 [Cryptomeria japonica]|uniref:uncharacterized protein LOC131076324 isoform X2 n=1 Tax=Cryptomeria japonica TaxID=3369 RepID=UPI0025ABC126|nr:uncharacterized protein LOC131076324 isoform X2 [Cryptomeria japonica]